MVLGDNLKKLRKQQNLRQEQLAEVMGVSTASVSKWETGQCAPELTMLMELADFFEVSVDSLIGHEIVGNRKDDLLLQLDTLINEERIEQGTETAKKLLRCYPNDLEVIQNVSAFYYAAYLKTRIKSMMEKSIELTKRLLTLESDATGSRHFELLSQLGNQYALIGDYHQARKYYTEGNVGNMNDAALAQLLAKERRFEDATAALSDICRQNIYDMILCMLQIADCWANLDRQDKAAAALQYGVSCLNLLHENTAAELTALRPNLYIELALHAERGNCPEQADAFIKKAICAVCEPHSKNGYDFCVSNGRKRLLGNIFTNAEDICEYLRLTNEKRLYGIAKGEGK